MTSSKCPEPIKYALTKNGAGMKPAPFFLFYRSAATSSGPAHSLYIGLQLFRRILLPSFGKLLFMDYHDFATIFWDSIGNCAKDAKREIFIAHSILTKF